MWLLNSFHQKAVGLLFKFAPSPSATFHFPAFMGMDTGGAGPHGPAQATAQNYLLSIYATREPALLQFLKQRNCWGDKGSAFMAS